MIPSRFALAPLLVLCSCSCRPGHQIDASTPDSGYSALDAGSSNQEATDETSVEVVPVEPEELEQVLQRVEWNGDRPVENADLPSPLHAHRQDCQFTSEGMGELLLVSGTRTGSNMGSTESVYALFDSEGNRVLRIELSGELAVGAPEKTLRGGAFVARPAGCWCHRLQVSRSR